VLLPEETRFLVRTRHVREEKDIEVLLNAGQLVDGN
jgi:hypothetical protein